MFSSLLWTVPTPINSPGDAISTSLPLVAWRFDSRGSPGLGHARSTHTNVQSMVVKPETTHLETRSFAYDHPDWRFDGSVAVQQKSQGVMAKEGFLLWICGRSMRQRVQHEPIFTDSVFLAFCAWKPSLRIILAVAVRSFVPRVPRI